MDRRAVTFVCMMLFSSLVAACSAPSDSGSSGMMQDPVEVASQAVSLGKDYLRPGEEIARGNWITSQDGRFQFVLQDDGNLVLYGPSGAKWSTSTYGRAVRTAILQGDGNLVLYGYDNRPVWASNTYGQDGASLVVQNDGNVVLYRSGAVWASNTVVLPNAAPGGNSTARDHLATGEELLRGQALTSRNGNFTFVMQDDGNLVLYGFGAARWASNTAGRAVRTAIMQGDGNLVLYGYDNGAVWASNTAGRLNPSLVLQNDGNAVIYATWAVWSTGTYE